MSSAGSDGTLTKTFGDLCDRFRNECLHKSMTCHHVGDAETGPAQTLTGSFAIFKKVIPTKIIAVFCPEATNAREVLGTALSLRARIEVAEFAFPSGHGRSFQDTLDRVKTWIDGKNLMLSLHGAFIDINPRSPEPLVREAGRKRVAEALLAANLLGTQTVSGVPLGLQPYAAWTGMSVKMG